MNNNLLNIHTPAESVAEALKADYNLSILGLDNLRKVYWNLSAESLYEEVVFRSEGQIVRSGPLVVNTGKHTARAADDKVIVKDSETENTVWWGQYNRPYDPQQFHDLFIRIQGYLQGKDVFVQDCYVGADQNYNLPIRVITERAWHSLFARNMFLTLADREAYRQHVPEFTIIALPSFKAFPSIDSTARNTIIAISFDQKLCIIGNSGYAGEIKKSAFTIMNYLLPQQGILPMHCSANVGKQGDVALFFGLSGTGKTTLSADPNRFLIGDDEHGWSEDGIFNFEGGCYAKVIGLSPTAEPQIYACTKRFGTILENVVYDPVSRYIDLDDDTFTENTRASYPLEFIENALIEKRGPHPRNILLLTCDASGVMPPIARLSPEQAIYHFISGYTAKVAGTEIGLREEPEITFSACFGGPFMVYHPSVYANLLWNKINRHRVNCWLINTGWVGGPFGAGKRISIQYTRRILDAVLGGELDQVEFRKDPVFGFKVPLHCPGVPESLLTPSNAWSSEEAYYKRYRSLASRFIDNFKKFEDRFPSEICAAGPSLHP
ncbi:MAG: phosphoenolpyruvate carboxykinase (ATP) [Anaerolineales bacterium]|nr:phosphoenolpyruvate carboxykinase (ATP) [Anaerolineales bacterium]